MIISLVIPLYVFLLIYLAFLVVIAVFVGVNVYHIFLSASFTLISFIVTLFVIGSQLAILLFTVQVLSGVDFGATVFELTLPIPRF